jgi:hypothetical protein
MNSRDRVQCALDHQEADRIPLDLGGSVVTGMHVSTVPFTASNLRHPSRTCWRRMKRYGRRAGSSTFSDMVSRGATCAGSPMFQRTG